MQQALACTGCQHTGRQQCDAPAVSACLTTPPSALQGKSIPASAVQLVLLISICTVAPLALSAVLEGSSRMKFLHTHKLPRTCLGTFWQHRLVQRVLASRLLHKAAHGVPGSYSTQHAN